jgi:hypothetical protein
MFFASTPTFKIEEIYSNSRQSDFRRVFNRHGPKMSQCPYIRGIRQELMIAVTAAQCLIKVGYILRVGSRLYKSFSNIIVCVLRYRCNRRLPQVYSFDPHRRVRLSQTHSFTQTPIRISSSQISPNYSFVSPSFASSSFTSSTCA